MANSKLYDYIFSEMSRKGRYPLAADTAAALILEAERYKLDPIMVLALVYIESSFNPKGDITSWGPWPDAADAGDRKEIAGKLGMDYVDNCEFDPVINIQLGTFYMSELKDHYHGTWQNALTAYNRGPGNTDAILKKNKSLPANVLESYNNMIMDKFRVFSAAYAKLAFQS